MFSAASTRFRSLKSAHPINNHTAGPASVPSVALRQAPIIRVHTPHIARANYYWSAHYQSTQIIATLIDAYTKRQHPDTANKIKEVMVNLMDFIVNKSRHAEMDPLRYQAILASHLSGLDARQLNQLSQILKDTGFDYVSYHATIEIVERNGRQKEREKFILLQSHEDFFRLLGDLMQNSGSNQVQQSAHRFPVNWNASARKILSDSAAAWHSGKETKDVAPVLLQAARQFATQLGMTMMPAEVRYTSMQTAHSTVIWQDDVLFCAAFFEKFSEKRCNTDATYSTPFECGLRDVFEAVLIKKMFGPAMQLEQLEPSRLTMLRKKIDLVMNQTAPELTPHLSVMAQQVMRDFASFGHISISPNGGGTGHSWIAPDFSIFPDNSDQRDGPIEEIFLHEADQLVPGFKKIRERAVMFISAEENEQYYPVEKALKIKVPVAADVLSLAASNIKEKWVTEKIPYRPLASTEKNDVHSCRSGVWEAVQAGMNEPARILFKHYNLGLPVPDSSAELAFRMRGFMDWLHACANQGSQTAIGAGLS